MEQATYAAGSTINALLDELLATRGPAGAIGGIVDHWKQVLTASDYAMGCPILAAAQSGPGEPTVQAASAAVFATWVDGLAIALVDSGIAPAATRSLASMSVSAIEGAIAQCRSARTTQPLDDVRAALTSLIDTSLSTELPKLARGRR
ncbi:hypothetical protein ACFWNH_31005 [Rhodococcus qingshengii]|uniref:LmrA/YxaF family transcription factor n=1 Tax=Rhodococcus qingshengii TaxID=334542 RepID=UPI00366545E0